MIDIAVLTVSSTRDIKNDGSGDKIEKILSEEGFRVKKRDVVTDDKELIIKKLKELSENVDIVITTGGTGLGPYDLTPEATMELIDKEIPGISELMRQEGLKFTKRAALSRGVSGIFNNTLIINLPGSPKGASQSLKSVVMLLKHSVHIMKGGGH